MVQKAGPPLYIATIPWCRFGRAASGYCYALNKMKLANFVHAQFRDITMPSHSFDVTALTDGHL